MLNARASAYQSLENSRNALLRIESKQAIVIAEKQACDLVVKQKKTPSKKNAHILINEWIRAAESDSTLQLRRVVSMVLQRWISNFYAPHSSCNNIWTLSPSTLLAEDLPHILTEKSMESVIDGLDVSFSTKEVYLSYARSLRDFVMKAYPITPVLHGRRGRLSLSDAAQLFEYLEIRALKSTKQEKYQDILICRALFYAPLPERDFFNMDPPDEKSSCLRSGDIVFCVPGSFTKLWKGFSCPKSLFIRTFDDKQLHKKIHRIGGYAKLTIELLTPSILRKSAKSICFTDLSITDDVIAFLPKRI